MRHMKEDEQSSGVFLPHVSPSAEVILPFALVYKLVVSVDQCPSVQQPPKMEVDHAILGVVVSFDLALRY